MSLNASSVNPAEIERIVREVLRNLAGLSSSGTAVPATNAAITLDASVISVDALHRLKLPGGEKRIQIRPASVVTPAARDWCRERGIEIVRTSSKDIDKPQAAKSDSASAVSASAVSASAVSASNGGEGSSKPRRLFIASSSPWIASLEKQLCPRQTQVDAVHADDASAMRSVARAIRSGNPTAMAIVSSPHSALWQAARDDALRPAIVGQWSDLADVLREVPTNVLIVPSKRWNIAGVANIARHFLDHSRSRS